jgi:hypothetical protein
VFEGNPQKGAHPLRAGFPLLQGAAVGHPSGRGAQFFALALRSGFYLGEDLVGIDITWVSDPLDPSRSFQGMLAQVIYERHRALGYL